MHLVKYEIFLFKLRVLFFFFVPKWRGNVSAKQRASKQANLTSTDTKKSQMNRNASQNMSQDDAALVLQKGMTGPITAFLFFVFSFLSASLYFKRIWSCLLKKILKNLLFDFEIYLLNSLPRPCSSQRTSRELGRGNNRYDEVLCPQMAFEKHIPSPPPIPRSPIPGTSQFLPASWLTINMLKNISCKLFNIVICFFKGASLQSSICGSSEDEQWKCTFW